MGTAEVRRRYLDFFKKRGHKIIPSASLLPANDPTTLFTGFGMQPLLPYLLGEPHPLGTRIVNSQKCFRTDDIEEVGDNRHTTIFEMLGNWSFGDYFKHEQLSWIFEFLTDKKHGIGLNPARLYVTVLRGDAGIPSDSEAVEIWKRLFKSVGIEASDVDNAEIEGVQDGRIFYYGFDKNWWSRVGVPDNMPIGEPGGPDSEIFFDFGAQLRIHEQSEFKQQPCQVNCDCGRFLEIGNSVFMMYKKVGEGRFAVLPNKNIDFGGGLERIVAASEDIQDIFLIDSFTKLIHTIEKVTGCKYKDEDKQPMRVIADHLKGATFLISDRVYPENKDQGYYLRRLLRRAATNFYTLTGNLAPLGEFQTITHEVIKFYGELYFNTQKDSGLVSRIIEEELAKFNRTLQRGLKEIQQADPQKVDGKFAFNLYQSHGLPFEVTQQVLARHGYSVSQAEFSEYFEKHQKISRKGVEKKFRGGLADVKEGTVKLHTATHLLHQALRDVLGKHVQQRGSNITMERLRFDFSHDKAVTEDELKEVEEQINQKIRRNLNVWSEVREKDKALKMGVLAFFDEKYADKVNVYFIGTKGDNKSAYSKELCGGPHVNSTKELGKFKIVKEQSAGAGVRRIYAKLSKSN